MLTTTVDNHNHYAKNPGTDPFKKKVSAPPIKKVDDADQQFFHNSEFKMDDNYHVALMVSYIQPFPGFVS